MNSLYAEAKLTRVYASHSIKDAAKNLKLAKEKLLQALALPKDTTELSKRIGRVPRSGLGANELATTDTAERDALLERVEAYETPRGTDVRLARNIGLLLTDIKKYLENIT